MNTELVNDTLKTVCREVEKGEDVSSLVMRMKIALATGNGVGLAANQIGDDKRVMMVFTKDFNQIFINPVIIKSYGGKMTSKEGCLSFPGKTAFVVRDKQIIVEGFDENWKPIKRKLKGMAAMCVQHEIDHLDGISIIDKASKVVG